MTATLTWLDSRSKRTQTTLYALSLGLGAVLLASIVEEIAGTDDLVSSSTTGATFRLAVPIMLAGLGALYSERSGVINIGLEGMMIAGTWFGAWGSWQFGPWSGVVIGLLGGAAFGLIHAVATVTFNVDHIVSGVAINILAFGGMRFASALAYPVETGGSNIQSPRVEGVDTFSVPVISDIFTGIEDQGWFFISDVAGVLAGITGDVSWLTLLAVLLVIGTIWVLWRTAWGLRLRSCGENPYAAESLGVNVYLMKYYGVIISGAMAGLGGAFLVLVSAGIYREAQTAGRGFIGLAALIFGNWMPAGVLGGSLLFGFGDALRLRDPATALALLLFIGIGLALVAVWSFSRGRSGAGTVQGLIGAGFLLAYFTLEEVPNQFLFITPYLITLLVLALAAQRLRPPAADGLRYRKGEAT